MCESSPAVSACCAALSCAAEDVKSVSCSTTGTNVRKRVGLRENNNLELRLLVSNSLDASSSGIERCWQDMYLDTFEKGREYGAVNRPVQQETVACCISCMPFRSLDKEFGCQRTKACHLPLLQCRVLCHPGG